MKSRVETLADSRLVRIVAVKREALRDACVFITSKEPDLFSDARLNQLAERINKLEPSGVYFVLAGPVNIQVFDRNQFKGKSVVVLVSSQQLSNASELVQSLQETLQAKEVILVTGAQVAQ